MFSPVFVEMTLMRGLPHIADKTGHAALLPNDGRCLRPSRQGINGTVLRRSNDPPGVVDRSREVAESGAARKGRQWRHDAVLLRQKPNFDIAIAEAIRGVRIWRK